MTKDRKHFTSLYLLKFNGAQIKLNLNGIVFTKNSNIKGIFLITNLVVDSTNSKEILRKILLSKE